MHPVETAFWNLRTVAIRHFRHGVLGHQSAVPSLRLGDSHTTNLAIVLRPSVWPHSRRRRILPSVSIARPWRTGGDDQCRALKAVFCTEFGQQAFRIVFHGNCRSTMTASMVSPVLSTSLTRARAVALSPMASTRAPASFN